MSSTQSHLSQPKYRPDIDGLRAVAVLAVVAFHAFPGSIKGGFIGVDIFFVISGFLISTIIFENLDEGTFSFGEFYARRIKRIFPALILVLLACYAFGWFALLADEYKQLGKHMAAGAGFVSNFVLWGEAGYFDNSAETKPLLHLWSLGIEEQFYFVWPLLVWFAWKQKFNLLAVTLLIAAISLFLDIHGDKDAVAMFYSPQTRFWELSSGSLLAWINTYKRTSCAEAKERLERWLSGVFRQQSEADRELVANALSFAGLLLLVYGFSHINKGMIFPGTWAVVPVLGAVLLISAGRKAWVNRTLLSHPVAVWFGVISFPLYLWHWPLLSFARIIESELPSKPVRAAAVVIAIAFAWLTYHLVEKKVRHGARSRAVMGGLVLLMTLTGCVGYATFNGEGLAFRENATLKGYGGDIGHYEYHKFIAEKYYICTPESIAREALKWDQFVRCMQSKPTPDVEIAIIGDSHAEHLFLGMAEALPARNVAFYIKGEPPFVGTPEFERVFKVVRESKTIKEVVITMHWVGRLFQVPAGSSLENELVRTADIFLKSGKKVVLTDDVPVFPFAPEKCKGKRWLASNPTCGMEYARAREQRDRYLSALRKVVEMRPAVKLVTIGDYLCDAEVCRMTLNDKVLYRDTNHLNLDGSLYIGKRLVEDNREAFF